MRRLRRLRRRLYLIDFQRGDLSRRVARAGWNMRSRVRWTCCQGLAGVGAIKSLAISTAPAPTVSARARVAVMAVAMLLLAAVLRQLCVPRAVRRRPSRAFVERRVAVASFPLARKSSSLMHFDGWLPKQPRSLDRPELGSGSDTPAVVGSVRCC